MIIRELHLPPDPVALGRALRDAGLGEGLAILRAHAQGALRPEDARFSFVAAEPVAVSHALVPPEAGVESSPAAQQVTARGWGGFPAGPRWVGLVPYEAMRGLERPRWTREPDERPEPLVPRPLWRRYTAVIRIDHRTGVVAVEGDDERSAAHLEHGLRDARARVQSSASYAVELRSPDEPDSAHVARIERVLDYIAAGDVYQVNVARRIPLAVRGDALALFTSLVAAAPAPYGLFAETDDLLTCAVSPELALEVDGDRLRTAPIKGTRPRGADARADDASAARLDADPKERAELTMAVDLHRNDLGRVAVPGSVRVAGEPRLVAGKTVWSRVSEVVATRARGASLEDVVRAMLPCGSVTGAPKVRAMEIIATLEPARRGLYTGAFGYLGRDGRLVLAMAIRTLVAGPRGGDGWRVGSYHAGGGIVADSDPVRELEETHWKAAQLGSLAHGVASLR